MSLMNVFTIVLVCMLLLLGVVAVTVFTASVIAVVRKFVVAIQKELRQKNIQQR